MNSLTLCFRLGLLALLIAGDTSWCAEPFTISTIAGGSFVGDGGLATNALLVQPQGIAVDTGGNLYIADAAENRVRRVAPGGVITTIAGTGIGGFGADSVPAASTFLNAPYGICTDRIGNLYIADLGNRRVRRVGPDGAITTFAGGGINAPDDGQQASDIKLIAPRNVAVDAQNNLYISDFSAHRVYRVSPSGMIALIAGSGSSGFSGDGTSAVRAKLSFPAGLAVDSQGVLYIADSGNKRVRRVYQGVITTVGDLGRTGGNALPLNTPTGVAVDRLDNLYVADGRPTILKLTPAGAISAVQTGGADLAIDAAGNIYSAGASGVKRLTSGVATLIVPSGAALFAGDGGLATNGRLNMPIGIVVDDSGAVYIADSKNHRIRKVGANGIITTVSAAVANPSYLAMDSRGALYASDGVANRIYRINTDGSATVIAGADKAGFLGEEGPASVSLLSAPGAIAFDALNYLYFADTGSGRIRKITTGGMISTVAGGGARDDDGPAAASKLSQPVGIAFDRQGNLYFSESASNRVRMLNRSGLITTVADAASAELSAPQGLRVADNGDILIADTGNHRIRRISAFGIASTVAGNGTQGFGGDDTVNAIIYANFPSDIALDGAGNLWFSDTGNNRIRKLTRVLSGSVIGQITAPSVTHGATFKEQPIAPGEILSIFGSGLGPSVGVISKLSSAGVLESQVAQVQVLFDGRPAPLFYVQDQQINVQAPYAITGQRNTEITVIYSGVVKARTRVEVQDSMPGLLTLADGTGQAVALNENGSTNSAETPADRGSVVVLYATGDGQGGADALDGKPAGFSPTQAVVTVDFAGYAADVLYAGRAPGFVGLMQINVRVPLASLLPGMQPVTLSVNGQKSQAGVLLALH